MDIFFQQIEMGPMANYVYFVGDPITRELAVVDPAWDIDLIRDVAQKHDYQLKHALITHGHPDHINLVETLLNEEQVQAYMHRDEVPWIGGWKETIIPTNHMDEISIGNIKIQALHTPGHTEGSQCFLFDTKMISGDTLFIDGCGRTDLPGGNAEQLYDTFNNVIKKLPNDTIIYPGHNYADDPCQPLDKQKKSNPYLKAYSKEAFLTLV